MLTVPEEIKVKSPLELLKKIKIGEDGLIVRSEYASGLFIASSVSRVECDS